jgi:uncharacterized RDD family membrane protein YckC
VLSPSTSNVVENTNHTETENVPAWKQELNQRLAATRNRRRSKDDRIALPGLEGAEHKADTRAAQLAAKVAQRYANAPSYSDVLAEVARAKEEAAALRAAEAMRASAERMRERSEASNVIPINQAAVSAAAVEPVESAPGHAEPPYELESAVAPVEPLAVNVIDRPRELVAPRKARPRLAEGPLREDAAPEKEQLRIFEVTSSNISQEIHIGKRPADWAPIRLDSRPAESEREAELQDAVIPLMTAPLEDRIMAGIFDLALIVAAFAVFVLVFVACTTHPPMGKPAMLGAAVILAGFGLLYHYLFFKFAEGTPGMRYAKIALCTFEDENPTRQEMCRRVLYLMLSAAPLGLGFAWAWFDPDRLSWHDRLSRIYQRSYAA